MTAAGLPQQWSEPVHADGHCSCLARSAACAMHAGALARCWSRAQSLHARYLHVRRKVESIDLFNSVTDPAIWNLSWGRSVSQACYLWNFCKTERCLCFRECTWWFNFHSENENHWMVSGNTLQLYPPILWVKYAFLLYLILCEVELKRWCELLTSVSNSVHKTFRLTGSMWGGLGQTGPAALGRSWGVRSSGKERLHPLLCEGRKSPGQGSWKEPAFPGEPTPLTGQKQGWRA